MATISDLKRKRETSLIEIKSLLTKESLSDQESKNYHSLREQINTLDREISFQETRNNFLNRVGNMDNPFGLSNQEIKDIKRFSFSKFLREGADNALTGIEREMHDLGKNDLADPLKFRNFGLMIPKQVLYFTSVYSRSSTGQNTAVDSEGGVMVGTMPVKYIDALCDAMILPKMGATYLSGLSGNLPIVGGGLFEAAYCEEGTAGQSTKMTLSKNLMKPKRVTANASFSRELLKQSSLDVENWIKTELIKANALAILTGAINGSGESGNPKGILNTSGIGDIPGGENGATPTFQHILDLETNVSNNNGDIGSLGYLTNSKVRSLLKRTLKASGIASYIWEDNKGLNGYYSGITNACPSNLSKGTSLGNCSAVIFGNWNDLFIGDWGGLDIIVDPYTLILQGEIEVTVHSFTDIAVGNPKSFAAMKDALTE